MKKKILLVEDEDPNLSLILMDIDLGRGIADIEGKFIRLNPEWEKAISMESSLYSEM